MKKGVTVKEKPKPKWKGWVEVGDDEEETLEEGAGKTVELKTGRRRNTGRAAGESAKSS